MIKKLTMAVFCLMLGFIFTASVFAQEEPVNNDNAAAKKAEAEKKVEKKAEDIKDAALGKTDGKTDTTPAKNDTVVPGAAATTDGKVFYKDGDVYVNTKAKFKLLSKDNVSMGEIQYKIDNGEYKKYESSFSIPEEGKHAITYFGKDLVLNMEIERTYKVIVDGTGPEMSISSSKAVVKVGEKYYVSKNHSFNVLVNDKLSGVKKVEYSINGQEYKECAVPFTIAVDGSAELKFKATDNVNNVNDTYVLKIADETGKESELKDKTVTFAVDSTSPVVEIKADKELKSKDGVNIAQTDVKYSITADDKESGIDEILFRLNGKGGFDTYKKAIEFKTNGEQIIEAKAVDRAGNVSSISTFKVVVDTIAPETTIKPVDEAADKD